MLRVYAHSCARVTQRHVARTLAFELLEARRALANCPLPPTTPTTYHDLVYGPAEGADISFSFTAPPSDDNGSLTITIDPSPQQADPLLVSTGDINVTLNGSRSATFTHGETVTVRFRMRALDDVLARYKPLSSFADSEMMSATIAIHAGYNDPKSGVSCNSGYEDVFYRYISAS